MTYGIRTTSTGAWVENCEFGTRAEAEAHLAAQWHREWIDRHEVSERSGTMGEQKWTKEPWHKGDDNSPFLSCTEPRQILGQLPDGKWCVLFSGNCHFPEAVPNAERAIACVNAMAGIPDPAAFVSRVAAMEEALKNIATIHSSDGHCCRMCGGAGGSWPCATRLEADAALAKSALEGGGCNGK